MRTKLTSFARFIARFLGFTAIAFSAQPGKPNILVILGDNLGHSDFSACSRGLMGFTTPHYSWGASAHLEKWVMERTFLVLPAVAKVTSCLATYQEFPPTAGLQGRPRSFAASGESIQTRFPSPQ